MSLPPSAKEGGQCGRGIDKSLYLEGALGQSLVVGRRDDSGIFDGGSFGVVEGGVGKFSTLLLGFSTATTSLVQVNGSCFARGELKHGSEQL